MGRRVRRQSATSTDRRLAALHGFPGPTPARRGASHVPTRAATRPPSPSPDCLILGLVEAVLPGRLRVGANAFAHSDSFARFARPTPKRTNASHGRTQYP